MVILEPNKRAAPNHVVKLWGGNVRARRKLLDWNQEFLEERSGVPQQTISKVENGRFRNPSIDIWLKLAKGLGANPAELYHWPTLQELAS